MNILVLGAGATGGYFGGRLAEAGADVTFLVRPGREAQLARDGLVVDSPAGDIRRPVATVGADAVTPSFEVVLLTCKAYDLDAAIAAIRPAMGPATVVLPLLNGLSHLDRLDAAFGAERVLGGLAQITATLTPDGVIRHLSPMHRLVFGPRGPAQEDVCRRLAEIMKNARFDGVMSERVLQDMWEKYVLIATLAGSTCLMRASLCDILAEPTGEALIVSMQGEAAIIADACGVPVRDKAMQATRRLLTDKTSTMAASMLRDVRGGSADRGRSHLRRSARPRRRARGGGAAARPRLPASPRPCQPGGARGGRLMTAPPEVTAAVIIIGNEVLSGRTRDQNLPFLAEALNAIGVRVREARIVADDEDAIVSSVNACRVSFDYVFTTGGIGPTHDDITSAAIAKAFGVALVRDPAAEARLRRHYRPDEINAARLRMADVPAGASLIDNPVSAAPGVQMENVFVLPGVPAIMRAMFDGLRHRLTGGAPMLARTLSAFTTEGRIAAPLAAVQAAHPEVEIGSYPFVRHGRFGVSLVVRGPDPARVDAAADAVRDLLVAVGSEPIEDDATAPSG